MTEDLKPQADQPVQVAEKTKRTRRSTTTEESGEKKTTKRKTAKSPENSENPEEQTEKPASPARKTAKAKTSSAESKVAAPRRTRASAAAKKTSTGDSENPEPSADSTASAPKARSTRSTKAETPAKPRQSSARSRTTKAARDAENTATESAVQNSEPATAEKSVTAKTPRTSRTRGITAVSKTSPASAERAPEEVKALNARPSVEEWIPARSTVVLPALAQPAAVPMLNRDAPQPFAEPRPPQTAEPQKNEPRAAEQQTSAPSVSAPAEVAAPSETGSTAGDVPHKKSRRGRRGGRNRRRPLGAEPRPEPHSSGSGAPSGSAPAPIAMPAASVDRKDGASALAEDNGEENSLAKGRNRRPNSRRRSKTRSPMVRVADTVSLDAEGLPSEVQPGADPLFDEISEENFETVDDTAAPEQQHKAQERKKGVALQMFISVIPDEQVEVVLTENGRVQEYYLDMMHQVKTKGNIYKGVINNIDANLQAAFVSYGAVKNGFLQIDEIHAEYWGAHHEPAKGQKLPPIQKVLKVGQEVLVQVVKEPVGSKGAFLSTYLSLPGRFLVLTPGQEQIGVSRKVEEEDERARLRSLLDGINPGEGLGVIVRTASEGTSKTTIQKDLNFLKRVWKEILKKGGTEKAPALLYKEQNLAERAVRDYLSEEVTEVWVDDESTATALHELVSMLYPRKSQMVRLHQDARQTLWERFSIQTQLEQIYAREVILPSGGRLVFDQTEALMAIDINSGKTGGKTNFESMALRTNIEAAEGIARQLKLRDIGGQVVIDFIEMRDHNHCREVEKTLRNAMKNDRARHDIGRMSSFGLLELVRQRTGSSALSITTEPCPCCRGTGLRRNMEWQALQALNEIHRLMRSAVGTLGPCTFGVGQELGIYLLNRKRDRLAAMEQECNVRLEIKLT